MWSTSGKNMAQSFFANGATRLHPVEWSSGVAAGTAAAMMIMHAWGDTRDVYDSVGELQGLLQSAGIHQPLTWTL